MKQILKAAKRAVSRPLRAAKRIVKVGGALSKAGGSIGGAQIMRKIPRPKMLRKK